MKNIQNIKMMIATDGQGSVTIVRVVGKADDGTYPHGDVTSSLSSGDKTALANVVKKIIAKLETTT